MATGFAINIKSNGTTSDVVGAGYYVAKTLKGTRITGGERDTFSFVLVDPPSSVIPVSASSGISQGGTEQDVEVVDNATGQVLFKGRIIRGTGTTIAIDDAGAYVAKYQIECASYDRDLDRLLVDEQYQDLPTGWIFRDIVNRYCNNSTLATPYVPFTVASIVTTSPPCTTLPYYDTSSQKPTQVFDYLSSVEGWDWYLDTDGSLHFGPSDNNAAPFSITDADVDEETSATLPVEPDSTNLFNYAIMSFNLTYNAGGVRFGMDAYFNTNTQAQAWDTASDKASWNPAGNQCCITGYGTNWGSLAIPTASFQGANATLPAFALPGLQYQAQIASYQPAGVDGYPHEVLYFNGVFSPLYDGPVGSASSPQPYVLTGIPSQISFADPALIKALAAITGDGGMRQKKLSDSRSFTFEEAQQAIAAQVLGNSNPLVNVQFSTTNDQLWTQVGG